MRKIFLSAAFAIISTAVIFTTTLLAGPTCEDERPEADRDIVEKSEDREDFQQGINDLKPLGDGSYEEEVEPGAHGAPPTPPPQNDDFGKYYDTNYQFHKERMDYWEMELKRARGKGDQEQIRRCEGEYKSAYESYIKAKALAKEEKEKEGPE